jgi:hypothetical protein
MALVPFFSESAMKRALIIFAFAATSLAQVKLEGPPQPQLQNANVVEKRAPQLQPMIDTLLKEGGQPFWIGYAVPMINKPRFICCFDSWDDFKRKNGCCSGCRLEKRGGSFFNSDGGTCVSKTPPTHFFVLLRIADGGVDRVQPFTPDCALDASGKTVYWLTGINSAQSIQLLESLAHNEKRKISSEAVSAIGLHADRLAEKVLEKMVAAGQPAKLREDAVFWLGQERGRSGYEIVRRVARTDADRKLREHAIFVMSQTDESDADADIIALAKNDADSHVRGQALFWLAQKASDRAGDAITDVMENDPDLKVKKQAVFALSQLPREKGVPLLIKYAKSGNPVVRKEAIFWLGQSEDPRALNFLEEFLLSKN